MMLLWHILGATEPGVSPSNTALIYGLIIALIGVVGSSGFQFYKYRKQAGREDDSLIAAATGEAVKAAQVMLEAYRVELKRAQEALDILQGRLEKANTDISRLEAELVMAREDRARLHAQLEAAVERRAMMAQAMEEMRRRIADLERVVQGSIAREDIRSGAWTPESEVAARALFGPAGPPHSPTRRRDDDPPAS